MNVNGVSGYSQVDAYKTYANASSKEATEVNSAASDEVAAVYEKSEEAQKATELATAKYQPNAALIEQMKADQAKVQNQLMSYVQESLMGQGNAMAASDDVWKFLASGNYTVSAAAKEEAQKAISEGGYWSAEKTSDRIVEFAKALTGGDPDKIEEMRSAIEKGFKEATKAWGKDLPDITNDTYDLIQKKLDNWANEAVS